ncbi:MAG: DNA/RNA helicase domain-containing protein [Desulfobacterales bacterium]
MTNDIGNIIHHAFKKATGGSTSKSEIDSWINSLQYMDRVLTDGNIPDDAGITIEYHIPQSSKRIDFILTGKDGLNQDSAILIELKQWEHASLTAKDAIVSTWFKHGIKETPHPSYQAWSYKCLLEDFNQTVQQEKIQLYPCAYLHNYEQDDVITNKFYDEYTQKAPVFLKRDALNLRDFIKHHIKYGDKNRIMYRIDHGKIKPSKNLADQLVSMLHGNKEFVMIDDQKVVYETAIKYAKKSTAKQKRVLIVEGGPGTGKSVVAINLLVELTRLELVARYVTRNSAPRLVYEAVLTGSFTKTHMSNMFSGSGSYHSSKKNIFDCLIVDEAHRLNAKGGIFNNLGENQIKEIISASKFSIFFIDEDQKVTLKDIGDKEEIRRWARELKANVTELKLESQFRCNGSDGYLAWLDNTLQIRETANDTLKANEYDFRIVDSPSNLHNIIREKNKKKNKARLVAGYCWKWISKKQSQLKDIVIGDYKATWNLNSDGQAWIIKPDSVSEVGCIHTCQGLELDYVGVIVGNDLIARNDKVITQAKERASTDRSIHGWRQLIRQEPEVAQVRLDAIIKNTYRTLMTRGQKGCYVYFVDDETRRFFEKRMEAVFDGGKISTATLVPEKTKADIALPFRRLSVEEVRPFENCVPLYDLKVAAGLFSDEQQVNNLLYGKDIENVSTIDWVELPDAFKPRRGLFVTQIIGESMNRRIPDGAYCLFSLNPVGTRQGKVVLVQHREISDTDTGGHYTIKVYDSVKNVQEDGTWRHESIILRPDTTAAGYEPIILRSDQADDLKVIAELIAVLY